MSRLSLTLPLQDIVEMPDGEQMVMFAQQSYDEADNITVIVTAMMTRMKWDALGHPNATTIELGE